MSLSALLACLDAIPTKILAHRSIISALAVLEEKDGPSYSADEITCVLKDATSLASPNARYLLPILLYAAHQGSLGFLCYDSVFATLCSKRAEALWLHSLMECYKPLRQYSAMAKAQSCDGDSTVAAAEQRPGQSETTGVSETESQAPSISSAAPQSKEALMPCASFCLDAYMAAPLVSRSNFAKAFLLHANSLHQSLSRQQAFSVILMFYKKFICPLSLDTDFPYYDDRGYCRSIDFIALTSKLNIGPRLKDSIVTSPFLPTEKRQYHNATVYDTLFPRQILALDPLLSTAESNILFNNTFSGVTMCTMKNYRAAAQANYEIITGLAQGLCLEHIMTAIRSNGDLSDTGGSLGKGSGLFLKHLSFLMVWNRSITHTEPADASRPDLQCAEKPASLPLFLLSEELASLERKDWPLIDSCRVSDACADLPSYYEHTLHVALLVGREIVQLTDRLSNSPASSPEEAPELKAFYAPKLQSYTTFLKRTFEFLRLYSAFIQDATALSCSNSPLHIPEASRLMFQLPLISDDLAKCAPALLQADSSCGERSDGSADHETPCSGAESCSASIVMHILSSAGTEKGSDHTAHQMLQEPPTKDGVVGDTCEEPSTISPFEDALKEFYNDIPEDSASEPSSLDAADKGMLADDKLCDALLMAAHSHYKAEFDRKLCGPDLFLSVNLTSTILPPSRYADAISAYLT